MVGPLVAPVLALSPMQAVVLDVVDDLQQGHRDERLAKEENHPQPAERPTETDQQRQAQQVPPDQFVLPAEHRQALLAQPHRFKAPGVEEVVLVGMRQELVDRLAETRRRSVLRRRHMHMVAAHMLDLEPRVAHGGQQDAAGSLLQRRVLVDQLMGDDDPHRSHHRAHREDPAQPAEPAPLLESDEHASGPDQRTDEHRHRGQGQQYVIALAEQLRRLGFLVGVGRVAAEQHVQQRPDAEYRNHQGKCPEGRMCAVLGHPVVERHGQRQQQPEPIGVLLDGQHGAGREIFKHRALQFLSDNPTIEPSPSRAARSPSLKVGRLPRLQPA
ncbi:hypothetical protein PAERUG_E6_London_17_VIM_2_12_12_00462 [Pseudomonas aeruginosa]|nr:hypothetical protein PAERUG_E6_London_17_VIM_2_12_12_00462 [Pseudomonas aeruginosa]CRQ69147.1 hypothetical protein PAERUG_E15_London_28_01_14_04947 [Pseudomonas aeruginosa]CRR65347.1 hypothetical protein PAERUG_E16_London_17_VIM_2_04_14_06244 [Pseudomonas aeruginosa]CRW66035.1 hypothetical protein PAERUG_P63_London_25_VIM_2_03_14_00330 [Pseudomonas aeruginosa]